MTSTSSPPPASAWPLRGSASWSSRLALPFRRSQTLRSQIDHHVRLLQRGVRPSTDAVAELCSLLRIGLGSAGMFAIPIVQPDKCERALYLYGHTYDRRDLLPLLEEARARLRWFGRTEPVRRLNLSTLRELGDELRERPPHERPGPVQIATFGIVLELTEASVRRRAGAHRRRSGSWPVRPGPRRNTIGAFVKWEISLIA